MTAAERVQDFERNHPGNILRWSRAEIDEHSRLLLAAHAERNRLAWEAEHGPAWRGDGGESVAGRMPLDAEIYRQQQTNTKQP